MALNNQPLIFNLDKTFNLFNLNAKQYDTNNSRSFTFNIIQNNKPFNLTGFNIKIGGVKSDRTNFFNDVNIVDVNNGIIELDLTAQMLTTAGAVKLEFLFFKDNVRLSSYPFEITVIPSVTNFQAIESSDEFGALTNALNKVDNTLTDVKNKVNGAVNDLKGNSIGGTNLLTGTQWFNEDWRVGYGAACTIDTANLFEKCAVLTSTYDWTYYCQDFNYYEIGKQYTISCYAKSDNGKAKVSFTVASDKTAWQQQQTTTEWTRYTMTFIATQSTGNVRVENSGTKDGADKIYIAKIKLEKGVVATDWCPSPFDIEIKLDDLQKLKDSCYKLSQEADANTNQIKSHNDTLYDLQHNWFSDCSNSLCINGFTSLKVYAEGVYYITGTAVTELQSIDHSAMKNGQCIYFIAETNDQTANIKFPASLSSSSVYTPKGQDFWITGRDNGDTIYIMQKIGGALRFRSL